VHVACTIVTMTGRCRFLACAAAVMLVAGGCSGTKDGGSDRRTEAVPLDPAAYSSVLAASDAAITPPFRLLDTADTRVLAAAGPQAAQVIEAQVESLRAVTPPAAAAATHGQLLADLTDLGNMVERIATNRERPPCPAATPTPYASVLTSVWADRVRRESRALAAADSRFVIGRFLPDAPAPPAVTRPANGAYVKAPTASGSGRLTIANAGTDATISLVPATGRASAALTVYVRGNRTWTVDGVPPGRYGIYYASGEQWNPARKGFLSGCDFGRFDDTFRFRPAPVIDTWHITMTPVAGGNASTSDVDPDAYPG
jgi:hypothetical protein